MDLFIHESLIINLAHVAAVTGIDREGGTVVHCTVILSGGHRLDLNVVADAFLTALAQEKAR